VLNKVRTWSSRRFEKAHAPQLFSTKRNEESGMSKSQSANINPRHRSRFALALMTGGLVAGCSSGNDPFQIDPEGYDGISETSFPLLANACTINTGTSTMTLSIRGGETLYVTLRAADSTVVASAVTAGQAECAVPATYKITITEDSLNTGVEKVFLDYINGNYALGSTAGAVVTPGITMTLGAGSSLLVRGSSGADKIHLGSTYSAAVLQFNWMNINGDTSPDVKMAGVTDIKVSTGVGADAISADGANGTTGTALDTTITFSAFGGPDADTLTGGKGESTLDGGDGDDKFVETATVGADNIVGGKGVDTVDYSVRTTAVNVTVCTTCALSDACGCAAANTACHGVADLAKTACDGAANTAKTACDGAANTAKTACDGAAATAKAACDGAANAAKATCDATANSDHATCFAACNGDGQCEAACDATQTADLAACASTESTALGVCTATETAALATCTATETAALAVCTATQTAALTTCTNTRNTAYAACDATQTSCQAACTTPLCAVCVADDGGTLEGDTVNDNVEIVLGSKTGDTISALYGVCSDQAATPVTKCTLKGNEGDDSIFGSAFVDAIDGGTGNDSMLGGLGDDTIVGGAGIDTVSYADRSVAVRVSLDASRLWVVGQNGQASENDVIAADIENLTGGGGNDQLRGNSGANIIHGGLGTDTIEGAAGNDALYGDGGTDAVYGGAGNDMLVGGAAADTLVGGDGDDFIDSADGPALNDTAIDCDGVNDSANTAGTAAGSSDALVKDGSDAGALRCEL
jgi:Ca2+-binding RTX toxin-like protein